MLVELSVVEQRYHAVMEVLDHVDPDRLVLDLLARGARPDPRRGWLDEVEAEVRRSLEHHARVSAEATGAWDSDWTLADDLVADGCRVLSAWVTAPLEVTLARLAGRGDDQVPVLPDEARSIHDRATRAAAARSFAARVDTAETSRAARELDDLVRLLG